jgi:hypothetical protein
MATIVLPEKAVPAFRHYFDYTDLWRYRFGYGDAYNLDPPVCGGPWYNHATFGIDQGPMLMSIENYRSGLIWDKVMRNSSIRRALCLLFDKCIFLPLIISDSLPNTLPPS